VDGHSSLRLCASVLCVLGVQRALRELVDIFAGYSLRLNTRLAYESRQRIFHSICASMRIDSSAPLTETQLCGVCILYAQRHRVTGLAGFVSAVAHYAMRMGHPDLPRGRTFDRVRAGILNWYGHDNVAQPARGFTLQDLHNIRPHLDLRVFADARDWCAALFAFFGLLRVKEYTCSGLLREHVSVHPWGISLAIPFSKTSLIPTAIAIIRRDDGLCPVAAHRAYTSLLPARLRKAALPYFLHDDSTTAPLTDLTFIRHVRRWVRDLLHASPAEYSGHSFRRGGTTALQMAGVPESTIASHGRWKSLAYRSYFDVQFNLQLRLAATAQLSLYDTRRLGKEPSL
jgi:hypothetical protein